MTKTQCIKTAVGRKYCTMQSKSSSIILYFKLSIISGFSLHQASSSTPLFLLKPKRRTLEICWKWSSFTHWGILHDSDLYTNRQTASLLKKTWWDLSRNAAGPQLHMEKEAEEASWCWLAQLFRITRWFRLETGTLTETTFANGCRSPFPFVMNQIYLMW